MVVVPPSPSTCSCYTELYGPLHPSYGEHGGGNPPAAVVGGAGGLHPLRDKWWGQKHNGSSYFCELSLHTEFESPSTYRSGRKVTTWREERENNDENNGYLLYMDTPKLVHIVFLSLPNPISRVILGKADTVGSLGFINQIFTDICQDPGLAM